MKNRRVEILLLIAVLNFIAMRGLNAQTVLVSSSGPTSDRGGAPFVELSSVQPPVLFPPAFIGHAPPRLDQKDYNKDHWKTSDGSDRYLVEFGAGIAQAAGASQKYQNLGWNIRLGAGVNFNRRLSALLEYDFNDFGIPTAEMNTLYGPPTGPKQLYGRVHLWSFTADPLVKYHRTEQTEEYVIGGGGYYRTRRRILRATGSGPTPSAAGLGPSQLVDSGADNAFGLNIGTGILWKVSYLEEAHYFVEVRYVWVNGKPVPDSNTAQSLVPIFATVSTQRTAYFPLTLGIRW